MFKSSISHCAVNKGCGAKHGRRRRRRRVVPGDVFDEEGGAAHRLIAERAPTVLKTTRRTP